MSDDQNPEAARDDHEEPVTFLGFVLSLAATAALHFGDMPDPQTGQPPAPNLEAAAHLVDILALLEQKTRGNLTAEERSVLDQVLYELRLRYVEAKKPQSRIIQP
jgi:Domain of unknown function (DUF1844)